MSDTRSLWYVLPMLFIAAGCSRESGVAPAGPHGGLASQAVNAPALHPNGVAYGSAGIHPATGRSGSAAIAAMAVYHSSGTLLTVTSYRSDDAALATPAGTIDKLLVKAFDASGRLVWTKSYNNLSPASNVRTLTLRGLDAGMRVAVQANVTGIDPRRTDVVTAGAMVVARPANLAVGAVQAESRWLLNTALPVSATVSETGGDLDVRANCVLYVDGVKADQITNMFVAAGDHVACNFTTTIGAIGAHELKVAVEHILPGDDNPLDNQALARVDVYSNDGVPLPSFNYTASVGDLVVDDYDSTATRVTNLADGSLIENELYVNADSGRNQTSSFTGLYYGQPTFPLARLILTQTTGGAVIDADTLVNLPQNGLGPTPCTVGSTPQGAQYSLCAYPAGYALLTYVRHTGLVNYRSQSYNLMFDPSACTTADGCWTDLRTEGSGTADLWGSALDFNVAITAGDTTYAAAPSVALGAVDESSVYGPTCSTAVTTGTVPGPFGITITVQESQYTCISGHHSAVGVAGAASGVGVTVLTPHP